MRIHVGFFACVLLLRSAPAQVTATDQFLEGVVEALARPDLYEVKDLIERVQKQGGFDVNNQSLAAILAAGTKANRDPAQMAALVLTCLRACEGCRARLLAPMTVDELKTLINWGFAPNAVLQEARVRGVKDLEMSEGAANLLRKAGANEDLITLLIPDDKLPTLPLAGYQPMALKHAEEYDANAPEGWLKIAIELPANSQSEFIFKHTGLFVRAIRGDVAKNLSAYFNKPAPRNTEAASIERGFIEEVDKRRHKHSAEVSYLAAGPDGRNAFRIVIANKESSALQYSFTLSWKAAKVSPDKTVAVAESPAAPSPALLSKAVSPAGQLDFQASTKSTEPTSTQIEQDVGEASLYWRGDLPPGETVTIQGTTATLGNVFGSAFPGKPISVAVVSTQVAIVEQPSAANGWTKIVLRNNGTEPEKPPIRIKWKYVH